MSDQVKTNAVSPMDLLLEVHNLHMRVQGEKGIGLVGLSAGDQRRCFNEGVKNYGDEGKKIHDKFNEDFLKKCSGSDELETLAKEIAFPANEEALGKINALFDKIDQGLTGDQWNQFWEEQQKQHGDKLDIGAIKETILMGYRFKVIQMIGFNIIKDAEAMKKNPKILNDYNNLFQAINGAKAKQATGNDPTLSLSDALVRHLSQGDYASKTTIQDVMGYI